MKIEDMVHVMQHIAPTKLAESWDNVGLLVGDLAAALSGLMLCIDYTPQVAREAEKAGCNGIIAYHPAIFHPLKRVHPESIIFDAIRRGVSIYSPHTALDVAEGGTNDMLADAVGLIQRRPLRPLTATSNQYKLISFMPEQVVESISDALFKAGAGRIGNYSQCSFRSPGMGTFFGDSSTHPAVGKAKQLQTVEEVRLEVIVNSDDLAHVVATLRNIHPYEEPAFDLIPLTAAPSGLGMGRVGTMPPVPCIEVLDRIKQSLGTSHLLVAGRVDRDVSSAAVCAGACGEMLNDALAHNAQLYLTGEMRHHDALRAAQEGMTVVCALHSISERAVLKRVKQRLEADLPDVPVLLSQADHDPFSIV